MKRFHQPLSLWLITLLAFALRVVRLDFQPLWWDEGYSVFFATRDFQTMLARTAIDIHPPLYYAMMQLWMTIVGKDAVALRWLSVVIGVVTIPLLYALARKLFSDPRIALVAAFLLAVSPFHIYYSQEVRMYGLVTLLGIASTYFFAQLLPLKPGTPQTIWLAAIYIPVTTAALYTQYYAAFIIAFQVLFTIWYIVRHKRELLRWRSLAELWANPLAHWLGAWVAIAVLYLPWVIYAGLKLYSYVTAKVTHEAYSPLDPIRFVAIHLAAFSSGHLTNITWLAWASVIPTAIVLLGMYFGIRRHDDTKTRGQGNNPSVSRSLHSLSLFYLLIPLALGFIINVVYPFNPAHGERLLLIAAPAFYLFAAIGIIALWNRRALLGTLGVVVISIIAAASLYDFYTVPRYANDDYRPLIKQIEQTAQPSDLFLSIYPWQIGYLESYYHGAPLNIVEVPSDAWINHPDQMQSEIDALLLKNSRVWIPALQTLGRLIEDKLDAYLRPRTYTAFDSWFGTTRLEMFARRDDPPKSPHAIIFSSTLSLAAPREWGVSDQSLGAGQDILLIWLDWENKSAEDFKLSLRLGDSKGNIWVQDDRDVEPGFQRIGFILPEGTPPGTYDLRLVVYQSADASTKSDILLTRVNIIRPTHSNLAAVPNRTTIDLSNGIRLVGYEANVVIRPGELTPITLFWQATRSIDKDLASILQVHDSSGKVYSSTQASTARGIYPTHEWQPNEIVRDPQSIMLRGDTPDGDYRILAAMIDPMNNTTTRFVEIGKVNVKGRTHYFGAPSPSNKIDARFDDLAQLIGYDIHVDRSDVRIVLDWKALGPSDTSYKVFVHLIDSAGNLGAQRDQIPGVGAFPTTSWVEGEYIVDTYDLTVPPGDFTISIGMYDAISGSRLPTFDTTNQMTGDHSVLPTRISVGR